MLSVCNYIFNGYVISPLNKVQEELLHYPRCRVNKMLNFYVKVFYLIGKALTGELSCPCDMSCFECLLFVIIY